MICVFNDRWAVVAVSVISEVESEESALKIAMATKELNCVMMEVEFPVCVELMGNIHRWFSPCLNCPIWTARCNRSLYDRSLASFLSLGGRSLVLALVASHFAFRSKGRMPAITGRHSEETVR